PAPSPTVAATPSAAPTPSPFRPPSGAVRVERSLPYASTADCGRRLVECQQFVDVYAPVDPGPWPVAVMIHGRPRTPADMAELARTVAARGAVVYNADYRGVRPVGQGWPFAIEDGACAIRYARATAGTYGGDPTRVLLVGHSFGGYVGGLVALAGDEFAGTCLHPSESALPDAWVGIAGNYTIGDPPHPLWEVFFGGTAYEEPQAWQQGNPLNHIGGNPELVVRFLHLRDDEVVPPSQGRRLVRELAAAGYDAQMTVLEGTDHWALLDPDGAGGATLAVVLALLGIPGDSPPSLPSRPPMVRPATPPDGRG
ncbi:MAG: alpha/beta fold hydrolase, partial [Chloroflexota bacterium]|nr:alpha/beta fold hydrolase [Chloroflexota bacterium]